MVKNGHTKLCHQCQKNYSMSHRYHGQYTCFLCSGIKTEAELQEEESRTRKSQLITQLLHEYGHRKDLVCDNLVIHDDQYVYGYWECGRKDNSEYRDYWEGWEILTWGRFEHTERHIFYKKYNQKDKETRFYDLSMIDKINWIKAREEMLDKTKS